MAMHSESRNGAKTIWLAVHTTEGLMRAADLRAWTTWPGSSHASSDETGVLMTPADGFVPYQLAAWTLRNGNHISENIEQCGWSRWTREEWLSRPKLLQATARWLADRSKALGIPLVRLSDADIRARKPGVLGHGDYSRATGDGTHSDPGPNYPWDVVLDMARNGSTQEDDMSAYSDQLDRIEAVLMRRQNGGVQDIHNIATTGLAELRALARVVIAGGDVDEKALAAALAPAVISAIGDAKGLTSADVEAAVSKVLARAANG